MNRHERRRLAAKARQNRFYNDYIRHLPEVSPQVLGKPGVTHMVFYHDQGCRIYGCEGCDCDPDVRLFAEPKRS